MRCTERANYEELFVAVALHVVHPKVAVDIAELGVRSRLAEIEPKLPGQWQRILTTSHAFSPHYNLKQAPLLNTVTEILWKREFCLGYMNDEHGNP